MHATWLLAAFLLLLLMAAFAGGMVLLGNRNQTRPTQTGPESPLDALARRFASGEINAEDYQKARDLLKGS